MSGVNPQTPREQEQNTKTGQYTASTDGSGHSSAPLCVRRCREAAGSARLVFKVDFGISLQFCDAAYPKDHESHEIVYWDADAFQEEPSLFEGIMKKAVEWDA